MSFKTKQLDQHINLGHDRKKDIASIYYTTKRDEHIYRELVEAELWVHLIRFMDKETARGIVKALMKIKDSEVFYKFTKGLLEVER